MEGTVLLRNASPETIKKLREKPGSQLRRIMISGTKPNDVIAVETKNGCHYVLQIVDPIKQTAIGALCKNGAHGIDFSRTGEVMISAALEAGSPFSFGPHLVPEIKRMKLLDREPLPAL